MKPTFLLRTFLKGFFPFFLLILSANVSAVSLSGTYTVGSGSTYTTLGAAITDINTNGVERPVILQITSDLPNETQVMLATSTTTAVNTITIKPASGVSPTITFSNCLQYTDWTKINAGAGFALNATSFVTIDGSNINGGTTKDMTMKLADATNGRFVILSYGNSDDVTIKNLIVSYASPMFINTVGYQTRGIYLMQGAAASDNFTLQNCTVGDVTMAPFFAIYVAGAGATVETGSATNLKITGNTLYSKVRAISMQSVGGGTNPTEISNNNLYVIDGGVATNTDVAAINYNFWLGILNIFNNKIPALTTANTGTFKISGIYSGSAQANAVANIYNNFIGGTVGCSAAGVAAQGQLINSTDPSTTTLNIYHNTIVFPVATNVAERTCIYFTDATVKLKNNIIINRNDLSTAYCINVSSANTITSDYNDFYTTGAGSVCNGLQTLSAWQAIATGLDANSTFADVTFVDIATGDLRIASASYQAINLKVARMTEVSTDIFGTTRPADTYKGAHHALDFTSGITNPQETAHIMRTVSGVEVILDNQSTVELYRINGMLIDKKIAIGTYNHKLNTGVYIIKVNGEATKFVK